MVCHDPVWSGFCCRELDHPKITLHQCRFVSCLFRKTQHVLISSKLFAPPLPPFSFVPFPALFPLPLPLFPSLVFPLLTFSLLPFDLLSNFILSSLISPLPGGPDVPPISKREQGEMIYDVLNIPRDKRTFVSIPLGVFDVLIALFERLEAVAGKLSFKRIEEKLQDAAEVARIVR
jgi:hypothetical protein